MRPRDFQRSRLYEAEQAAFGVTRDGSEPAASVAETQARVDEILSSAYVRAAYPMARRSVPVGGRKRFGARAWAWKIETSRWARQPGNWWVIVHEVAHVIDRAEPDETAPGHGPRFAGIYLDLIRAVAGSEQACRLGAAYEAHGVRWDPRAPIAAHVPVLAASARPKRRRLPSTPEVEALRAAARERVRRWRVAKKAPAGDPSSLGGHHP